MNIVHPNQISVVSGDVEQTNDTYLESKLLSGFINQTAILSFVDGTRTFTITGDHVIYILGKKYSKTTDSIVIANIVGTHYIYYDANGVLSESTSPPAFYLPFIATVYWEGAKGDIGEERHTTNIPWSLHYYLHLTVGARYITGLAGTFNSTTFSIASGSFADEDLTHTFLSPLTTCNLFYKNGSPNFTWDGAQTSPYKTVAGTIQYNNGNALANVTPANYVAYWVFATNSITTPIMILMGQRQDVTIAAARANNTYESLVLGDLPYKEAKILYRVLFQNVAGVPTYVETQDLRSVSNLPGGTYVATDHNVLSNIQQAGSGVQYGHIGQGAQTFYGHKSFDELTSYVSHPTFSADTDIVDKKYVDERVPIYDDLSSQIISGGETVFTLSTTPSNANKSLLFLNGQKLTYGVGKDFTISGTTLTYSGITLIVGDILDIYYYN